ncbi:MAG TPA: hypothetical protein DCL49_13780 [Candidatus Omnitrophica bacterium]|nr:hypothetical protein [Candidatus Omnitrophota bacterium]HBG62631.1 hypothetical protein [Candidatus Omnitrophota bacterium]
MANASSLKFLANVNIEKPVVDSLLKKGFDVKWVTDIDKKMPDTRVCEIANSENRIILTNDKDFGEIVFLQKKIVQGIVLLRIKGQDAMEKAGLIERLLDKYPSKIIRHFVVVTKEKFRFIPLEVA